MPLIYGVFIQPYDHYAILINVYAIITFVIWIQVSTQLYPQYIQVFHT